MADTTETKPDPTTTSTEETTPAPAVEKTEGEEKSVTEKATDAALGAATKATDNVFSMFGGGPKKEKKEEADDADEPSGSSKAKAGEEVSFETLMS
jgi:Ran-binding protein 1